MEALIRKNIPGEDLVAVSNGDVVVLAAEMNFSFSEYLDSLSRDLGAELKAEDGTCTLLIGDQCPLNITVNERRNVIELSSVVADDTESIDSDLVDDLLNSVARTAVGFGGFLATKRRVTILLL